MFFFVSVLQGTHLILAFFPVNANPHLTVWSLRNIFIMLGDLQAHKSLLQTFQFFHSILRRLRDFFLRISLINSSSDKFFFKWTLLVFCDFSFRLHLVDNVFKFLFSYRANRLLYYPPSSRVCWLGRFLGWISIDLIILVFVVQVIIFFFDFTKKNE